MGTELIQPKRSDKHLEWDKEYDMDSRLMRMDGGEMNILNLCF